jgi:dTDP-4-amino-4,6-dideoxygalactose transaminase
MSTSGDPIPFNKPHTTGRESEFLHEAVNAGHLSGNGRFGRSCSDWIAQHIGGRTAFVTPSCTAALEMAMILADIGPGDEVIMPSYTFVSCANAVVLRGGTPVFVDVEEETLNLDPDAVAKAMTDRTKAVIVVHYAGVGANVERLADICEAHGALLVEDAAHCIQAWRNGRPLGSFGAMSTFSFHETKNVQCGEGGALVINHPDLVERAEIIQEKGTNRQRFLRGQVDKYTWVDVGSSFLMSDVTAAFLWAQMLSSSEITERRLAIWNTYQEAFSGLEEEGLLRRPTIPAECEHNAHIYALRLEDIGSRDAFIAGLAERGVHSVFHYVPLHKSPAGAERGRTHGSLSVTESEAYKVARLPLFVDLLPNVDRVVEAVIDTIRSGLSVEALRRG